MIDERKLLEKINDYCSEFDESLEENKSFDGYNIKSICMSVIAEILDLIQEQPKVGEWIPVEERLPEEKKFYEEIMRSPLCLVTVLSDDELMVGIDRTVNGVWTLDETFDKTKIIAWKMLPEPYSSED